MNTFHEEPQKFLGVLLASAREESLLRQHVQNILQGIIFSTYAKFSKKLRFLTPWYAHTCAYQGVRVIIFSENFAYIVKGWSPGNHCFLKSHWFTNCNETMWFYESVISFEVFSQKL